jgi:predicted RNA binding protein YcfA (HicA-like mRNA interferase family)
MTRREKALHKMRNNPKQVGFSDLAKLLEQYDFEIRKTGGSHQVFMRGQYRISVPFRKPHLLEYVVKDTLKILDKVLEEES